MRYKIARLHFLTNDLEYYDHVSQAIDVCQGGVKWIQLRTKNKSYEEWLNLAIEVKKVTDLYNAVLIINDNPTIAKESGANGVHLGKEDMSVSEARKILGKDAIIGATANTSSDILELTNQKVNYIGLGPYRYTSTKENLSSIIEYSQINALTSLQSLIPIILIGGIKSGDIEDIVSTGAYGIAVSSAINQSVDKFTTTRSFVLNIQKLEHAGFNNSR